MPAPRIVAISCVRNECDIIEPFVRHTLALVDHLIVMDHASTDATTGILHALVDEGLPLEVVRDERVGFAQSEQMTELLRRAAALDPSWVVPVDVDELLQPASGTALVLPDEPGAMLPKMRWRTHVPRREDDAGEPNPVLRLRHRLAEEPSDHPKVLIPGHLARRPDAVLTQGNHGLTVHGQPVPAEWTDAVALAHFPLRDLAQHAEKVATRWLQQSTTRSDTAEEAFYAVAEQRLLARDWPAFAETFWDAVPPYLDAEGIERVEAPATYLGGPLRYTAAARSLGEVLGRTVEQADRAIRAAHAAREGTGSPATATVVVRALRNGVAVASAEARAEIDQPLVVRCAAGGAEIDAVELTVDQAQVLVEVVAASAGAWAWATGVDAHPVVEVADDHAARLPHLQVVRVLQALPNARVRLVPPVSVVADEVEVELVVVRSAERIRRTVLDRSHVWALHPEGAAGERTELRRLAFEAEVAAAAAEASAAAAEERAGLAEERAHCAEERAHHAEERASEAAAHLDAITATRFWQVRERVLRGPAGALVRRLARAVPRSAR